VITTLDYAHQNDVNRNPNDVSSGYWLLEAGLVRVPFELVVGQARLEGRSATDKITTPQASPLNGRTELFALVASRG
jgi:hypothetical protein